MIPILNMAEHVCFQVILSKSTCFEQVMVSMQLLLAPARQGSLMLTASRRRLGWRLRRQFERAVERAV